MRVQNVPKLIMDYLVDDAGKINDINPVGKYLALVFPAKAGSQRYYWMPDQVRQDEFCIFSCRFNIKDKAMLERIKEIESLDQEETKTVVHVIDRLLTPRPEKSMPHSGN